MRAIILPSRILRRQPFARSSVRAFSAPIDFNEKTCDTKLIYESKSTYALVRAYVIFQSTRVPAIVNNAEKLLQLTYSILGDTLTNAILKNTYFGHFCAGEDETEITPVINDFEKYGISSILDYAAKADEIDPTIDVVGGLLTEEEKEINTRTNMHKYDERILIYEMCLRSANVVKGDSSDGFIAVKVTHLVNPILLEKMSKVVIELRNLFLKFDKNKTGMINKEDFQREYNNCFAGEKGAAVFDLIDTEQRGLVDYVSWSNSITVEDLHLLTSQCREKGPLFHATFSDHERELLLSFRNRVRRLAKLADDVGVSMMIDAEHTYFQPAIDNVAITLMKEFNTTRPVIFSTYQMYLVDSECRLHTDLIRARQGNYFFAAKFVRGAYMELERQLAYRKQYDDPIHVSKQDTDDNYNRNIEKVVMLMAQGEKIELMIASHNQESVELTLRYAKANGLAQEAPIHFAQLMGMADNLTFLLGHEKYKVYKYVPYGAVKEVMPYLVRRAQENAGMLDGVKSETNMLSKEIKARMTGRR
jgi:proline dehydrogenase